LVKRRQFLVGLFTMTVLTMDKEHSRNSTASEEDDAELKKMGYEAVLHRGLTEFSNFAFGFTEVAVLVSFTSQYSYGLQTGGKFIRRHRFRADDDH
jgi:hypothetical protein